MTEHDQGCQSGDFGPCDCSLSKRTPIPASAQDTPDPEEASYDRANSVPVAWIAFAANGNIRLWTSDEGRAKAEKERGLDLRTFTLAELVALAAKSSDGLACGNSSQASQHHNGDLQPGPSEAQQLADRLEPLQYAVGIPFKYLEFRLVIDALRSYRAPGAVTEGQRGSAPCFAANKREEMRHLAEYLERYRLSDPHIGPDDCDLIVAALSALSSTDRGSV